MKSALDEVPNKRSLTYTDRLSVACEPELKRRVESLKEKGKDHAEWLRRVIRKELERIGA